MTTFNDSMRQVAQTLLDSLGMTATLIRETRIFDKAESRAYVASTATYSVKASPPEPYVIQSDGVRQKTSDLVTMIAAQGLMVEPRAGDKLTLAGATRSVVAVSSLYAGDDPVVFELQLKG